MSPDLTPWDWLRASPEAWVVIGAWAIAVGCVVVATWRRTR